jgi:hypothetical protein
MEIRRPGVVAEVVAAGGEGDGGVEGVGEAEGRGGEQGWGEENGKERDGKKKNPPRMSPRGEGFKDVWNGAGEGQARVG